MKQFNIILISILCFAGTFLYQEKDTIDWQNGEQSTSTCYGQTIVQ